MSDLEFSGSDSEPVSDVNAEEMAKLMADLGDLDDDNLHKSKAKSVPTKKDDKDSARRVTFDDNSSKNKAKNDDDNDDDDDWDADDLLQSDDEVNRAKTSKTTTSDTKLSQVAKSNSPSKEGIGGSHQKTDAKKQLMSDLFSNESNEPDKKFDSTSDDTPKRDKSKLMSDLFGGDDMPGDTNKKSPGKKTNPSSRGLHARGGQVKKAKDEVSFDDDDDDILGTISDSKPRGRPVSDSPKSSGFMDSLLGKSSALDKGKEKKEKLSEFVLDDKYKNIRKDKKEDEGFGGYMPSSRVSESPRKRAPKKEGLTEPLDFLSDIEPRRRNPRSASHQKPFEVDDEDILGNIRSNKGKEVKKRPGTVESALAKSPSASSKSKDTDWLFGSSSNADVEAKQAIDNASLEASVEQSAGSGKSSSPEKSDDWLGSMLSGSKKSPTKPHHESSISNLTSGRTNTSQKTPSPKVSSSLHESIESFQSQQDQTHIQKTLEVSQQEILMQQQAAEAQSALVAAQMKMQQEQLLQQQEAKMKAASLAASQMKMQKEQLETMMNEQLLQQQQQMAQLQESAMKNYQEALVTPANGMNFNMSVKDARTDESMRDLQIQVKSAELDVARLTAELELVRKQHKEEMAIIEDSLRRRHEMEKDVWERTELRLKEERDGLLSEFQGKVASLQVEKESLVASHEMQLTNVKKEWSLVVERTKELYSDMAERMKVEHGAALERMTYLKDLELNAAVSASGHVKDVDAIMTQLESNTANLSDLTSSINTRQDSALDITQRALKLKEKQLKDFEAQLEASRAEAESERGRLNILITRLEGSLSQQGAEVEKEKWRLSQELMKLEIERKSLAEERRHSQMSLQSERQNLASARETLLSEHKMMLQSVAQEKQEVATQRAKLAAQQNFSQVQSFTNFSAKPSQIDIEAQVTILHEEQRRLQEKMTALTKREKILDEEEERLNQLSSKLMQDKVKITMQEDFLLQEKLSMKKMQEEVDTLRQTSLGMRDEQQKRLVQITVQTQALHMQQEKLEKEQLRLNQTRDEVNNLVKIGQCPSCQNRGASGYRRDSTDQIGFRRLPGDGGEGQITFSKLETSSMSPTSVLARLVAAREQENADREKRLLQLSALESS